MEFRYIVFGCAVALSLGCQQRNVSATTEDQAVNVANAHLAANFPRTSIERLKIEKVDMGDRWRIAYQYRDGGTGGPIVIVVNKRTGKVVHFETQQ